MSSLPPDTASQPPYFNFAHGRCVEGFCCCARSSSSRNHSRSFAINSMPGSRFRSADVDTAEALLANAQSLAINVDAQRAQSEHAIAMLIGRPPAELSVRASGARRNYPEASGRGPGRPCSNGGPISPPRNDRCSSRMRSSASRWPRIFPISAYRRRYSGPAAAFSVQCRQRDMVARRGRNAAVVRRRVARGASRRRARRLLAKRRDLSPDRAVGVPGSRGSACCHPRADPTDRRATEGRVNAQRQPFRSF